MDAKSDEENFNVYNEMLTYICDHFRENINTTIVARECFVSRGHASKVFFKHAKKHMKDYIDELRVDYANKLLEQGNDITTTSTESGFGCIRTFNNVYKKVMGITPTQYYIEKNVNKNNTKGRKQK